VRRRSGRPLSKLGDLPLEPSLDDAVVRREPLDKSGERLSIVSIGGGLLALRQVFPVHVLRSDLDDEQPRPETLAAWRFLAGADDKPTRRPRRPQRGISAHSGATGLIALGTKYAVRFPMLTLNIRHTPGEREVVDD
jgi:hypothetical protein